VTYARGLVIPIPPLAEQHRIVAKLEQVLASANAARERLARVPTLMKRFRQSVLATACSGRLTADWREQNPDVEPASQLLERILAERRARWEATQRAKKKGRASAAEGEYFFGKKEVAPARTLALDLDGSVVEQLFRKQPVSSPSKYQEPAAPDILNAPELPEIPDRWITVSVGQVSDFLQYGTSTKTDATPESGIAVLRMGNIQDGKINYTDLKYLDSASKEVPVFLLQEGDILFNRTNSPELVGKSAVYEGKILALFASYLVRLRCSEYAVLPNFVCHWINSWWGKEWAEKVKTDGVSQSNVNATKLGLMPMPLPPLAEQQEIVRRVEALFQFADAVERRTAVAAARADKLVQAILARAFRGELVPTEAELARAEGRDYEPASVLLQRIQAGREQPATGRPTAKKRKGSAKNNDANHLFSNPTDAKDGYKTKAGK
jgi:type I restriction enzyme S subunit